MGLALCNEAPSVEDQGVVGDAAGLGGVVADQDHGQALGDQFPYGAFDGRGADGVEGGGGLVEQ